MDDFADWGSALVFIPLWLFMAAIWFGAAARLKKGQRPRTRKILDNLALVLSLGCAAAVLVNLDCQSVIQISFLDPVCSSHDLQLTAWVGM
jgi:hypothetical protein